MEPGMDTKNSYGESQEQEPQDDNEKSPIDDIIARVDSYEKNPRLVTPATLGELKSELMDLKSYLDNEEAEEGQEEGQEGEGQEPGKEPGLAIIIGRHMAGK